MRATWSSPPSPPPLELPSLNFHSKRLPRAFCFFWADLLQWCRISELRLFHVRVVNVCVKLTWMLFQIKHYTNKPSPQSGFGFFFLF